MSIQNTFKACLSDVTKALTEANVGINVKSRYVENSYLVVLYKGAKLPFKNDAVIWRGQFNDKGPLKKISPCFTFVVYHRDAFLADFHRKSAHAIVAACTKMLHIANEPSKKRTSSPPSHSDPSQTVLSHSKSGLKRAKNAANVNTEEEARDELVVQTTQEMMVDVIHSVVTDCVQTVVGFETILKGVPKVVAKEMSSLFVHEEVFLAIEKASRWTFQDVCVISDELEKERFCSDVAEAIINEALRKRDLQDFHRVETVNLNECLFDSEFNFSPLNDSLPSMEGFSPIQPKDLSKTFSELPSHQEAEAVRWSVHQQTENTQHSVSFRQPSFEVQPNRYGQFIPAPRPQTWPTFNPYTAIPCDQVQSPFGFQPQQFSQQLHPQRYFNHFERQSQFPQSQFPPTFHPQSQLPSAFAPQSHFASPSPPFQHPSQFASPFVPQPQFPHAAEHVTTPVSYGLNDGIKAYWNHHYWVKKWGTPKKETLPKGSSGKTRKENIPRIQSDEMQFKNDKACALAAHYGGVCIAMEQQNKTVKTGLICNKCRVYLHEECSTQYHSFYAAERFDAEAFNRAKSTSA